MAFTKSFPKKSETSVYPQWEEITLSKEEETKVINDMIEDSAESFEAGVKFTYDDAYNSPYRNGYAKNPHDEIRDYYSSFSSY